MGRNRKVANGIELLLCMNSEQMPAFEVRDILFRLISKDYNVIDAILSEAVKQGILQRSEGIYHRNVSYGNLDFERPVKRIIEEKGKCVICGKSLTKCCYIEFPSKMYGPFGLDCVRKVHLE